MSQNTTVTLLLDGIEDAPTIIQLNKCIFKDEGKWSSEYVITSPILMAQKSNGID